GLPERAVFGMCDERSTEGPLSILTVCGREGNQGGDKNRVLGSRDSIAFEVPGNIDDYDAAIAAHEQDYLQQFSAAVVQQVIPPVADYQLRDQYADFTELGLAFHIQNVIDHREDDVAVRRFQNLEPGNALAGGAQGSGYVFFPIAADLVGII